MDANSKFPRNNVREEPASGENGVVESTVLVESLARLDMKLACSSEKLTNLELYRVNLSLGDFPMQNSINVDVEIEKALVFDVSLGYLDSEVTELGRSMKAIRVEIIDAHKILYELGKRRETCTAFEEKLYGYECSWKHLRDLVLGLERRIVNMRGTALSRKNSELDLDEKNVYASEDVTFERPGFDLQTAGQQRLVLKMLDTSISGELNLERQLFESKERERELEFFVELALEKLLEAEHSTEVYTGTAKEMMTRLQSLQFNVHCSSQREGELKIRLQIAVDQLKEKDRDFINVENGFQRDERLEVKIKMLEDKLKISESMLEEVNASYDVSQDQLALMENTVETLRAHIFMAETRAQSAEDKLSTLTEETMELREEVAFLKGEDDNVERISLLEKQVRDLEVQLQTSEASLEQQNMLYTAIWDMETLIEELRSKVSKADNRADNAETQCLDLAETNMKLSKEISYLKSNIEKLEFRIKEANEVNVARMNDISCGTKLITDVVAQLASERARIQNQLSALTRENKILLEELRKMRKMRVKANGEAKELNEKDSGVLVDDPKTDGVRAVSTIEAVVERSISRSGSNQVDEPADEKSRTETEPSSSSTSDVVSANVDSNEPECKSSGTRNNKKRYTFAAIIILVLSILAVNVNWRAIAFEMTRLYAANAGVQ